MNDLNRRFTEKGNNCDQYPYGNEFCAQQIAYKQIINICTNHFYDNEHCNGNTFGTFITTNSNLFLFIIVLFLL